MIAITEQSELQKRLASLERDSKRYDQQCRGDDEHYFEIEKQALEKRLALAKEKVDSAQDSYNNTVQANIELSKIGEGADKEIAQLLKSELSECFSGRYF
jgi:hypothetical protein